MKKIEGQIDHQDDRGVIIDLVENSNINAVTYITLKRGAVRGNHYHKKTTQWNYVIAGEIKFVTQADDEPVKEAILGKGDFAVTEPMEKHALVGLQDAEILVFTQGPRGGKEYESDTFRLETPLARD
jgi:quercetin dioxygenase-like cupin family protein